MNDVSILRLVTEAGIETKIDADISLDIPVARPAAGIAAISERKKTQKVEEYRYHVGPNAEVR